MPFWIFCFRTVAFDAYVMPFWVLRAFIAVFIVFSLIFAGLVAWAIRGIISNKRDQ